MEQLEPASTSHKVVYTTGKNRFKYTNVQWEVFWACRSPPVRLDLYHASQGMPRHKKNGEVLCTPNERHVQTFIHAFEVNNICTCILVQSKHGVNIADMFQENCMLLLSFSQ